MKHAGYRVVEATGCWEYLGYIDRDGYAGLIRQGGRPMRAARAYYVRSRGEIPDGMEVDHLCRNRACVNPDHLELVTRMVNCRRGSQSKLGQEKADAIRRLSDRFSYRDLAFLFSTSSSIVCGVVNGTMWRSGESQ